MITNNENDLDLNIFLKGLKPDPNFTVSSWADQHRILSSVSASEPGIWRTSRTPYLKEIMDCLSPNNPCQKVVFMKGAQIGGTECGNNWMGFVIHHAPGPMLIVNPTVETAKRTSKMRIDPAIQNCPALKERVNDPRSRDSGNTTFLKEFPGGVLILTGANSAVGLRSMPIRYLFLDEVDGYPDDASGEGDPINLAIQRTATFFNRKIFMISTPTIKNFSRIETAFLEGDQRYYFVPCLNCGEFQTLEWSQVKWPKNEPQNAYYECKKCQCHWHDYQKQEILSKGRWQATSSAIEDGTISFHLSSLYSPYGWISFGDIAKEFSLVHKDPPRLQVWTNIKLAQTWEDSSGVIIDPTGLMARRENFGKYLPKEIVVLTAGVDVQDNRLEIEIIGWGKDEESWSIDYKVIYGDPSAPNLWHDLDIILNQTYEHSKDIPNLEISATCIDSGGHYTDSVINYADQKKHKKVFAIKGSSSGFGIPIWPIRASQNKRLKKPVYVIGVDDAKETLMQRLRITESGSGCWHFPMDRDASWFSQITSEVVKTKYVKGRPIRQWQPKKEGIATEGLDCRVYGFAALKALIRNWNLDLNKLAEKLSAIPIKNTDTPRHNLYQNQIKTRRVRSKGII